MLTTIDRYMWLRIDGESYKVVKGDFIGSPDGNGNRVAVGEPSVNESSILSGPASTKGDENG